ncbi:MAG: MerR family transcriptional regulator [Gammaproteobacteria bacterium]|nr:MerR family transcriptional regulator [Gammaproteobacteria bacterium]
MDVDRKTINGFTTQEVCGKSGLNEYQLKQLRKKQLLEPVKQNNAKLVYRFQDMVVACDIGKLVDAGTSFAKVVDAYSTVRRARGEELTHSSAIKFIKNSGLAGGDILVQSEHGLLDPETGERAFDFDDVLQPKRARLVRTLESLRVAQRVRSESPDAEDWYQYALDCEDDENDTEAKRAYEICISHDESNADAWVNLGRLHFLSGRQLDSRYCYEKALAVDCAHQIGNYNLGILFEMFESNELAIEHLKRADGILESFQCLARIYKKMGDAKRADDCMKKFFELSFKET